MVRTRLAAFFAVAAAVSTLSLAPAGAQITGQNRIFFTVMNGSQETPPNTSPAIGTAIVFVNPVTNRVCVFYSFSGLVAPAVAAHIHEAPPGVAGPIRIPFPKPPSATTGADFFCTIAPADVVARLVANPSNFYVNVHSTTYPGGEIRGQLVGVGV